MLNIKILTSSRQLSFIFSFLFITLLNQKEGGEEGKNNFLFSALLENQLPGLLCCDSHIFQHGFFFLVMVQSFAIKYTLWIHPSCWGNPVNPRSSDNHSFSLPAPLIQSRQKHKRKVSVLFLTILPVINLVLESNCGLISN